MDNTVKEPNDSWSTGAHGYSNGDVAVFSSKTSEDVRHMNKLITFAKDNDSVSLDEFLWNLHRAIYVKAYQKDGELQFDVGNDPNYVSQIGLIDEKDEMHNICNDYEDEIAEDIGYCYCKGQYIDSYEQKLRDTVVNLVQGDDPRMAAFGKKLGDTMNFDYKKSIERRNNNKTKTQDIHKIMSDCIHEINNMKPEEFVDKYLDEEAIKTIEADATEIPFTYKGIDFTMEIGETGGCRLGCYDAELAPNGISMGGIDNFYGQNVQTEISNRYIGMIEKEAISALRECFPNASYTELTEDFDIQEMYDNFYDNQGKYTDSFDERMEAFRNEITDYIGDYCEANHVVDKYRAELEVFYALNTDTYSNFGIGDKTYIMEHEDDNLKLSEVDPQTFEPINVVAECGREEMTNLLKGLINEEDKNIDKEGPQMETLFENDMLKISSTGRDYDFIATVENKTDDLIVMFDGEIFTGDEARDEMEFETPDLSIEGNDWGGILADEQGLYVLEQLGGHLGIDLLEKLGYEREEDYDIEESVDISGMIEKVQNMAKEYADLPSTMAAFKNNMSLVGVHLDGDKAQIEDVGGKMYSPADYPHKENLVNTLGMAISSVEATAKLEKDKIQTQEKKILELDNKIKTKETSRDLGTDR